MMISRVIVTAVFEAASLTAASEKKTPTMLLQRTPGQTSLAPPLVIEAAGEIYRQATQLLYLGGVIHKSADLSLEIERRVRLARACLE